MPRILIVKQSLSYDHDSYEVWRTSAVDKAVDCTEEEAKDYRNKVNSFNRLRRSINPTPDFQLELIEILAPKELEDYFAIVEDIVAKEEKAKEAYKKKQEASAIKRKTTEVERKKKKLEHLKKELENDPS